jgi:hypothetical protein
MAEEDAADRATYEIKVCMTELIFRIIIIFVCIRFVCVVIVVISFLRLLVSPLPIFLSHTHTHACHRSGNFFFAVASIFKKKIQNKKKRLSYEGLILMVR